MDLHGVLKQKVDCIKIDIVNTIFGFFDIDVDDTIIILTDKCIHTVIDGENDITIHSLNIRDRIINICTISDNYWVDANSLTTEQLLNLLKEVELKKYN